MLESFRVFLKSCLAPSISSTPSNSPSSPIQPTNLDQFLTSTPKENIKILENTLIKPATAISHSTQSTPPISSTLVSNPISNTVPSTLIPFKSIPSTSKQMPSWKQRKEQIMLKKQTALKQLQQLTNDTMTHKLMDKTLTQTQIEQEMKANSDDLMTDETDHILNQIPLELVQSEILTEPKLTQSIQMNPTKYNMDNQQYQMFLAIEMATELYQLEQNSFKKFKKILQQSDLYTMSWTYTDQRYNYVISQLQLIKKTNCGFFFSVLHEKCNFRHIHLIHDCSFINSCRCTILKNIPINRRLKRNTRLICDLDNDYVENLVNYFTTDEYKILQIFFGGTRWTLLDQDHGKCFIFFKY